MGIPKAGNLDRETITDIIVDIIVTFLSDQGRDIRLSDRINVDLGVDEEDMNLDLVAVVQRTFGHRYSSEDWGRVVTVDDLIELVATYEGISES